MTCTKDGTDNGMYACGKDGNFLGATFAGITCLER